MIRIEAIVGDRGVLCALRAIGHAGANGAEGSIACAAVTVLARTAARLLHQADGLEAGSGAPLPGVLEITVATPRAEREEWLRGVTDFLMRGLMDLSREYPEDIEIRMGDGRTEPEEEDRNGEKKRRQRREERA